MPDTLDQKIWPEINKKIDENKKIEKEFLLKIQIELLAQEFHMNYIKNLENNKLEENFKTLNFKGSAGQSFGSFAIGGLKLNLNGDANDYVGKGFLVQILYL